MKTRIYLGLSALAVGISIYSALLFVQKPSSTLQQIHPPSAQTTYYGPISMFYSGELNSPYVTFRIEDQTISMHLDLGFQGEFALLPSVIETIQNKKFLCTSTFYSIRGTEHKRNIYEIPLVYLGKLSFHPTILHEEPESLQIDAWISDETPAPAQIDKGRVGWKAFRKTNLLFDAKNSRLAIADSLQTLKNNGYELFHFVQTPLILDHGLIEIEVTTPNGPIHCGIDTGASENFLFKEANSLEDALQDPDFMTYNHFLCIQEESFGPLSFANLPACLPKGVSALLGMPFLKDHVIFIDFTNNYVYIAKNPSSRSKTIEEYQKNIDEEKEMDKISDPF